MVLANETPSICLCFENPLETSSMIRLSNQFIIIDNYIVNGCKTVGNYEKGYQENSQIHYEGTRGK